VQERAANTKHQFEKMGYRLYFISAQTGKGVKELMEAVSQALESISGQVHEE